MSIHLSGQQPTSYNAIPLMVRCSDWWAPHSTTGVGLLHQLNPVRVKYIRALTAAHFGADVATAAPLQTLRVADVGCGGGILAEALARIGGNVVAVDPGVDNIAAAKRHAAQSRATNGIDYRCCTSGASG